MRCFSFSTSGLIGPIMQLHEAGISPTQAFSKIIIVNGLYRSQIKNVEMDINGIANVWKMPRTVNDPQLKKVKVIANNNHKHPTPFIVASSSLPKDEISQIKEALISMPLASINNSFADGYSEIDGLALDFMDSYCNKVIKIPYLIKVFEDPKMHLEYQHLSDKQ